MVRYKDINKMLAQEFFIDEKQVQILLDEFWYGVRRFASNPTTCPNGIMIPRFLYFYPNYGKMKKSIDRYTKALQGDGSKTDADIMEKIKTFKEIIEWQKINKPVRSR